jgi:hypothetical protein
MLHTHSCVYHRRCIRFFSKYFSFPCQYHFTNDPYSFIHLPSTLYNVFLPVLHFPPISIIPPIPHTQSSTTGAEYSWQHATSTKPATLGCTSDSVRQEVLSLNIALLYSLSFTLNAGIINKRLQILGIPKYISVNIIRRYTVYLDMIFYSGRHYCETLCRWPIW